MCGAAIVSGAATGAVGARSGTIATVPTPIVFSWSAGKDSAFGLWTLLRDKAYDVRALLTTLTEGYDRVSLSGVREELLDRQAEALGLPVIKVRIPPTCVNELYEQRMASTLAAEEFRGIDHVAFSDLFLVNVRAYREERLVMFPHFGGVSLLECSCPRRARRALEVGLRRYILGPPRRAPQRDRVGRFDRPKA